MSKRILLVDDNPDTARYARMILNRQRYDVEVATSGRQALDMAGASQPNLVLLDLRMPGLDGFAVLQVLKSSPTLKKIPVVVLSGKRKREDVARAIREGAADYVTKPIDEDVLLTKIRSVLQVEDGTEEPEEDSSRFAQRVVNEEGTVTIQGQVEVASENEVLFFMQIRLEPKQSVELSMPLFAQLGIEHPLARIVSRSPGERDGHPGFFYCMELVGLPEADRQRLRKHAFQV